MRKWLIEPGALRDARIRVPGDKSISHRCVLFASLARGTTTVEGFLPSEDCLATVAAVQSLGVAVTFGNESKTQLSIEGSGGHLKAPEHPIDCGNSGTAMRLLAGVLAGQSFSSQLIGDQSLMQRPMRRIIDPLEAMGAKIGSREGLPPLEIEGRALSPVSYSMPMASAQVKSALFLAGLMAEGESEIIEPAPTRDHSERLFRAMGVVIASNSPGYFHIRGGQTLEPGHFAVPGDISSAAFWMVAAAVREGLAIELSEIGLNPTRRGVIDVLMRMGASIEQRDVREEQWEPRGKILIVGRALQGTTIAGAEIANVIDELPILAVAGALAHGETIIRDARELRVKETDRIAAVADNLQRMGVNVEEREDGMRIQGGGELRGATISSYGDHRIAMAFAIAALFAQGETVIEDVGCVDTSYPGFAEDLIRVLPKGFSSL